MPGPSRSNFETRITSANFLDPNAHSYAPAGNNSGASGTISARARVCTQFNQVQKLIHGEDNHVFNVERTPPNCKDILTFVHACVGTNASNFTDTGLRPRNTGKGVIQASTLQKNIKYLFEYTESNFVNWSINQVDNKTIEGTIC